ncbi:hypothetical protein Golob_009838, partial [Gossypium lobatum]|nr:hypothetical protein [Gossypium lobatum]
MVDNEIMNLKRLLLLEVELVELKVSGLSFQKFISNADPYTLSALSGGKVGEVSPDLFKTATNMIGKMSPEQLQKMMPPEELQKMFEAAASLKGNDSISTSTAVKSSRLDSDAE